MTGGQPSNSEIADVLQRIASLLEAQDANPHRVRAYRSGASTVRNLDRPVTEIVLEQGDGEALRDLPDIGEGLARIIERYVRTGRSGVLERPGWAGLALGAVCAGARDRQYAGTAYPRRA